MADFTRFGEPSREWLQFLEQNGPLPAAPIGLVTPTELREATNSGREKVAADLMKNEGLFEKVSIMTTDFLARDGQKIPVRIYSPKEPSSHALPVYVFYHGGGFLYGTLPSEDATCSRIVALMPIVVIHINYRHTPDFGYPVPQNDAFDGFDWIIENLDQFHGDPSRIVVGGVSAGASLAAAVVLKANSMFASGTGAIKVKGQILGIPWLVISSDEFPYGAMKSVEKSSRHQCSNAPILSQKVVDFFVELLHLNASKSASQEFLNVGLREDERLIDVPNTAFMVAGMDPLRDDGLLYAQKLHQNSVPTKVYVFTGLPHGFQRFKDLPSSKRWDQLVVENLQWVLGDHAVKTDTDIDILVEDPLVNK